MFVESKIKTKLLRQMGEAIKLVRERTGLSLKDAKDAVVRLDDLMRSRLGRLD